MSSQQNCTCFIGSCVHVQSAEMHMLRVHVQSAELHMFHWIMCTCPVSRNAHVACTCPVSRIALIMCTCPVSRIALDHLSSQQNCTCCIGSCVHVQSAELHMLHWIMCTCSVSRIAHVVHMYMSSQQNCMCWIGSLILLSVHTSHLPVVEDRSGECVCMCTYVCTYVTALTPHLPGTTLYVRQRSLATRDKFGMSPLSLVERSCC